MTTKKATPRLNPGIPGQIGLGDTVRDMITGLEGMVVCKADWLFGCVRFVVAPPIVTKDGVPAETHSYDESQLIRLAVSKVAHPDRTRPEALPGPGGPQHGERAAMRQNEIR